MNDDHNFDDFQGFLDSQNEDKDSFLLNPESFPILNPEP